MKIWDASESKLNSITCTRPAGSTAQTCDFRTNEDDLQVQGDLEINYEMKQITLPNPPSIADARTNFINACLLADPANPSCCNILSGPGLTIDSATKINGAGTINSAQNDPKCHLGSYPPGSDVAYHCIVSSINLSGDGKVLNVDTSNNQPVYFYLQQNEQNINIGGNGVINHLNNGSNAPLSLTSLFQIRGITKPNGACTSSQNFELRGNASTAMFIWGPCAKTSMRGTTNFGGILWTNILDFSGGGNEDSAIRLAIPSNPGTCVTDPSAVPCRVLRDIGELDQNSRPIDWAARSINFTRFF